MRRLFDKYRTAFIVGFVILFIVLWIAFRPDLLFVKHPVDEALPGSTSFIPFIERSIS